MSASRTSTKSNVAAARRLDPLQTFVWEGTDKRGVTMKGEQTAKTANIVRADLRRQGLTPKVVKVKGKPLFGGAGKTIKPGDIAVFSRQIATMIKSGVPIVQALEIISGGQKNPKMRDLIGSLRAEIEGGTSLYDALGKHPIQFDQLFRNLVKAGESAGVLETVLDTIATYKENIEAIKGKIKKALFYPIMVVAVAIIVSAILLIFVVPTFEKVFKEFGADLPALTLMVMGMSRFTVSWWWLILLVGVGLGVGFIALKKRSTAFSDFLDRALLKLPVVGQL